MQTLYDYLKMHPDEKFRIIDEDGMEVKLDGTDDPKVLAEVKYVCGSRNMWSSIHDEVHVDRLYFDGKEQYVTERQLYVEWMMQRRWDSLDETFPEYRVHRCSRHNGDLRRVM